MDWRQDGGVEVSDQGRFGALVRHASSRRSVSCFSLAAASPTRTYGWSLSWSVRKYTSGSESRTKCRVSRFVFTTSVCSSSRKRAMNLPRTRRAGVPNAVPASAPGKHCTSSHTRCHSEAGGRSSHWVQVRLTHKLTRAGAAQKLVYGTRPCTCAETGRKPWMALRPRAATG